MKVLSTNDDFTAFLYYVACQKRNLEDWRFLHIHIRENTTDVSFDELEQFLVFHIQNAKAFLLKIPATNEFLVFSHKEDENTFNKFERAAYENFNSQTLRVLSRGFERDGLEVFSKIIKPHVKSEQLKADIAFKRMARPANSIVILDDDLMILKQMEKVLSGYGNVITCQDVKGFQEAYVTHAPNVLFLDIHLREGKGNSILKGLKKTLDPQAHVIMISSDTDQSVILDVKHAGADGFVIKPINRTNLYQQLMKAETLVTKV
ncbi:MAG: response regulator [Alphaproteobacteria bacterium]